MSGRWFAVALVLALQIAAAAAKGRRVTYGAAGGKGGSKTHGNAHERDLDGELKDSMNGMQGVQDPDADAFPPVVFMVFTENTSLPELPLAIWNEFGRRVLIRPVELPLLTPAKGSADAKRLWGPLQDLFGGEGRNSSSMPQGVLDMLGIPGHEVLPMVAIAHPCRGGGCQKKLGLPAHEELMMLSADTWFKRTAMEYKTMLATAKSRSQLDSELLRVTQGMPASVLIELMQKWALPKELGMSDMYRWEDATAASAEDFSDKCMIEGHKTNALCVILHSRHPGDRKGKPAKRRPWKLVAKAAKHFQPQNRRFIFIHSDWRAKFSAKDLFPVEDLPGASKLDDIAFLLDPRDMESVEIYPDTRPEGESGSLRFDVPQATKLWKDTEANTARLLDWLRAHDRLAGQVAAENSIVEQIKNMTTRQNKNPLDRDNYKNAGANSKKEL